jgi:uncharacterized protein (DUF1778 family)
MESATRPRKDTWPTASTRLPPDELRLIDAAAIKVGQKRSKLIYEATMARVREILGIGVAA